MSHNCCYKCERRTAECHKTCKEYKAYRKALDEKNKELRSRKDNESMIDGYFCEQKLKNLKGFRYDGKGNKI